MSGPKMARFQQNIRKVSEKKMGRDTNSPVAANGFCTVSEPNCVRLSWIDHTGAGHTTNMPDRKNNNARKVESLRI